MRAYFHWLLREARGNLGRNPESGTYEKVGRLRLSNAHCDVRQAVQGSKRGSRRGHTQEYVGRLAMPPRTSTYWSISNASSSSGGGESHNAFGAAVDANIGACNPCCPSSTYISAIFAAATADSAATAATAATATASTATGTAAKDRIASAAVSRRTGHSRGRE